MSREIKFRAWDGEKIRDDIAVKYGKVIFEENPPADSGVVIVEAEGRTTNYHSEWAAYEQKSWELMQFTGLVDKEGTEIYEGDIVRVDNINLEDVFISKVIFTGLRWTLVDIDGDLDNMEDWKNDMEVVGNIFENPELMEVEI